MNEHDSTALDGRKVTPRTWGADWADDAAVLDPTDHDADTHAWEWCDVCVRQAIEDGMLAAGSMPLDAA